MWVPETGGPSEVGTGGGRNVHRRVFAEPVAGLPDRFGGGRSNRRKYLAVRRIFSDEGFAVKAQVAWKMPHQDGLSAFTVPGRGFRQAADFRFAVEQGQLARKRAVRPQGQLIRFHHGRGLISYGPTVPSPSS